MQKKKTYTNQQNQKYIYRFKLHSLNSTLRKKNRQSNGTLVSICCKYIQQRTTPSTIKTTGEKKHTHNRIENESGKSENKINLFLKIYEALYHEIHLTRCLMPPFFSNVYSKCEVIWWWRYANGDIHDEIIKYVVCVCVHCTHIKLYIMGISWMTWSRHACKQANKRESKRNPIAIDLCRLRMCEMLSFYPTSKGFCRLVSSHRI